jgi:predicted  nucleic acid-binding Zn-ribbon protein
MRFGGYAAPYQRPDPKTEMQTLKNQAEALESELDSIRKRIDELESHPVEE